MKPLYVGFLFASWGCSRVAALISLAFSRRVRITLDAKGDSFVLHFGPKMLAALLHEYQAHRHSMALM
jgi:hypothetical protein